MIEDFLEFSRKLRLKVYFHNRDVENGGESDHISVREQVGEDLEFQFVGPTPWKKNSEFEPYAGEKGDCRRIFRCSLSRFI